MLNQRFYRPTLLVIVFLSFLVKQVACQTTDADTQNINRLKYTLLSFTMLSLKNTAISYTSHFLKNNHPELFQAQYRTSGVYDGGMSYSFFIPLKQFRPYYAWWDTGILLMGSGIGVRQVLSEKWFDQSWFVGVYGYYDVIGNVEHDLTLLAIQYVNGNTYEKQLMRKDLPYKLLYPVRFNMGVEFGGSDWGQITFNGYGMLMPDVQLGCTIREKGGFSVKLSLNLYPTLRPFLCGAVSFIERQYGLMEKGFSWRRAAGKEDFTSERVTNMAVGFRWTVTPGWDFEMKYFLHDSYNYLMPFHLGCQLRYGETNKPDGFQGRLHRTPDRYIPYYPHALKFHPVFSGAKLMVDRYLSRDRASKPM